MMMNDRKTEETTMNGGLVGVERTIPGGGTHMRLGIAKTWAGVCCVITLLCAAQTYGDDVKKEGASDFVWVFSIDRNDNGMRKPLNTRGFE